MSLQRISALICSVGMFLFGIDAMGTALQDGCSQKMKKLLAAATKNKLAAVLSGAAVTAVIQSSCAATVMTLNLVSCGAITLAQATGVIMGANIGTTATSILIAFSFSSLAPPAVFFGALMKMFSSKKGVQNVGLALAGFGLLFAAMSLMQEQMSFLSESGKAAEMIAAASGRLSCFFAGFSLTAVMQSSSATVGLLQTAAANSLICTRHAVYILFGQNVGAVLPTVLASFKGERQAKQAAMIHLLFNLIGTAVFALIAELTPYIGLLELIKEAPLRISAAHIAFNVVSTAILLPFSDGLIKLSDKLLMLFPAAKNS